MKQKEANKYKRLVSFSLMGPESGALCEVECEDGKIVRINPYEYDTEYTDANCNPWHMEARGKTFDPPQRVNITHMGLCYKTRVYSPNRILYPMKRIDWDPEGERHPETRGISGYERISWEEAAKICANEIKRINKHMRRKPSSANLICMGKERMWHHLMDVRTGCFP